MKPEQSRSSRSAGAVSQAPASAHTQSVVGNTENGGREVASGARSLPSFQETEGRLRDLFSGVPNLSFSLSEEGQVVSVMGDLGNEKTIPGSVERILRSFAMAYGLQESEVSVPQKDTKGGFSDLYVAKQVYQGFDVFGGGVQASVVRESGNIFVAGSYLYPVESVNLDLQMTAAEAEAIIRAHYKGKGVSLMTPTPQTVVYSMDDPRRAEKAFVFQVSVFDSKPKFTRVVVGFESKRVLYELPLSYH